MKRTNSCNVTLIIDDLMLLAPTGALVLMMVYYISEAANPLFQIWSIYAFLYCYKCHSKSLKQYQCN